MKDYHHRSILIITLLFVSSEICKAQQPDLVFCANEKGKYFFESLADIAYGYDGKYVFKNRVTGWVTFDNETFGDPYPNHFKEGYFVRTDNNSIRLYKYPNFQNFFKAYAFLDVPDLFPVWSDQVQSIRVPAGYKLIAYEDVNYNGASIEITGEWTITDSDKTWSNRISSFRVVKNEISVVKPINTGVTIRLYEHANFESPFVDVNVSGPVALTGNWDNNVSSIKVPDGYKLLCYDRSDLQGDMIEITGDWTLNPENMGWNDRISSMQLIKINTPVKKEKVVRAFKDINFGGSYKDFEIFGDPKTPHLFGLTDEWHKTISSLQIPEGYKVIAYEQKGMRGSTIELTGNWTASTQMDWDNRIGSFQLMLKTVETNNSNSGNNNTNNNNSNNRNNNNGNNNNNNTNNSNNNNPSTGLPANIYVRVFENPDFTGESRDFGFVSAILGFGDLNKKVSSIRIRPGYKIIAFDKDDLKGSHIEITKDWSANNRGDWNDRISSIRLMDINTVYNPDPGQTTPDKPLELANKLVSMTTRHHKDKTRWLSFSSKDKKFYLKDSMSYLKMIKLSADRYKILLPINGKNWALSSTPTGFPLLTENKNDNYQVWQFDKLANGSYKITNVGLVNANSPYPALYCDPTRNVLFLNKWKPDSSLNAEWNFHTEGNWPRETDQPDAFDNKYFSLESPTQNKPMCITSYLMGGDVATNIIGVSRTKPGKIGFVKTVNGDYFIKINNEYQLEKFNYIDDRLGFRYEITDPKFDILNPNPKYTWKLIALGNATYKISNTATRQVLEIRTNSPYSVTLANPADRNTQLWYLR